MTEKAKKYLTDILYAIEKIDLYTQGILDFEAYDADSKTKSAVERQVAIIGEAVSQFKKHESVFALSFTPQMIAVRNRLIHAYDNVDDPIIGSIVEHHLAPLKWEVPPITGVEKTCILASKSSFKFGGVKKKD